MHGQGALHAGETLHMETVQAVGLLSGGLDSMLATQLLKDQGIDILALSFKTPFFGSARAEKMAAALSVPLRVLDISEIHLQVVRYPEHGWGKNMNPCIDCHALMFNQAGKVMEAEGADFLFSGEVLNERPMSQNRQSLAVVAKISGYADVILRPLSAKLLPETLPERLGKVDRSRLLDVQGRSRRRQMDLAAHYGLTDYPAPAGGCKLTEPNYSARLRELFAHPEEITMRNIHLLAYGRHFRLASGDKIIVGRHHSENEVLLQHKEPDDAVFIVAGYPGPVCLAPARPHVAIEDRQPTLEAAAAICARYSDAPPNEVAQVECTIGEQVSTFMVRPVRDAEFTAIRIQ